MKIRSIAVLGLGILGCHLPAARAFQPPARPPLPNYDVRVESPSAAPDGQQEAAVSTLKARVPLAQFSRDRLLGVPRLIAAERGFLTGPNGRGKGVTPAQVDALPANDLHRSIKAFVNEHSALFGHDAAVFNTATVTRDYVTAHNGMRSVVWQQTVDDVPVFEAIFMGHLTAKGELISVASRFVPNIGRAVANGRPNHRELVNHPPLSAARAVAIAARNLGSELEENSLNASTAPEGNDRQQSFRAPLLRGDTNVRLCWLPLSRDSLRLCWRVDLTVRARSELYSVLVDVESGEVQVRQCLTAYIRPASYNVYTSDSPSPFSPGHSAPATNQPPLVSRQVVSFTALSTNASPNGWINDGDNETRGNNVDAHTDRYDVDAADLPRPQGTGTNRLFDFPLDLTKGPATYTNAAVVNLFYWNNFMHDKLYELGFTEAAGNFQNNNFGRGGRGNDAVQADGQDGGALGDIFHVNNANFATPPDGSPGRMQMYVFDGPNPDRDGDLDAEIMCHEYTHGLSTRLVGGGVGISALQTAGMGEGWSDFYGLSLLSEASDDVFGNYASGGYVTYRFEGLLQNYYYGIRRYPYTTDLTKNPLTFKDIDPNKASPHLGIPVSPVWDGYYKLYANEVHFQGEVWCVTLWEARVAFVEKWGFAVGNPLILRTVTDGMKLAPENPTFLEARDAIIRADEVASGGENFNELWIAFAKRGMGYSAKCPVSDTTVGVIEAFDLPPGVGVSLPDGILEVTLNPPDTSALFAGSTQAIFLRITDALPVTNASITATINGTNFVFHNDGVAPDLTANNSIYSANFRVPTDLGSVTLSGNITATNKDPATFGATYTIIRVPANDNFTNAIKIPANGGTYFSNNKLATFENGEPAHAGLSTATASLWWTFAPTTNGPVLVDTAGSTFNSVVAVYTNSTLDTLGEVASADDVGTRSAAFVVFNGRAGVNYRIAVASANASSTGTLFLNVAPNAIADTNPPVVAVSSPLSGLTVTTNRVLVAGTATEPEPAASGIRDVTLRVTTSSGVATYSAWADSLIIQSNWSRQVGLSPGVNTIEVTSSDVAGNKSAPITLEVIYRPLDPPNDVFANALALTATPDVSSVNTAKATKEFNEPYHAGNAGGKSVWWWFQPPTNGAPSDGVLSLSTTNSTFDTLLAVYTGTSVSSLTPIAANDDAAPGQSFSALTLAVRSNQIYRIAVDGFDGASGAAYLHYAFTPATVYDLRLNTTTGGHIGPAPSTVASNDTVVLTAIPDQFYQFVNWSGDVSSSANPLTLAVTSNVSLTANFSPIAYSDDFETGNLSKLAWSTAGDVPWSVQNSTVLAGSFSARSGAIGGSQSSSLRITGDFGGGAGSFYFKVSSEPGWDFLQFYVDDILVEQWSGEVGWQNYPFNLGYGTHTLEWRYAKDAHLDAGLDAAFLDNVNLPFGLPIDSTTAARLQMIRQADGSLLLQLQGQANRQYTIQGATDLKAPIQWQDLATKVATNGVIQYVDPDTASNQYRYYRAVTQ